MSCIGGKRKCRHFDMRHVLRRGEYRVFRFGAEFQRDHDARQEKHQHNSRAEEPPPNRSTASPRRCSGDIMPVAAAPDPG